MTLLRTTQRALALAATVTFISAASAMAADNNSTVGFTVKSAANSKISTAAAAFKKGNYERSVTFSRSALKDRLSDRRAAIAHSNLCAAYAKLDEMEKAQEACATALELRPGYEPAETNKAALTIRLAQK